MLQHWGRFFKQKTYHKDASISSFHSHFNRITSFKKILCPKTKRFGLKRQESRCRCFLFLFLSTKASIPKSLIRFLVHQDVRTASHAPHSCRVDVDVGDDVVVVLPTYALDVNQIGSHVQPPPRTHGLNLSLSLARTSILSYEVNLSYAFSLMTLTHPPKCIHHTMSFLKAWFSASLSTCLSGYFTEQKCSNELTERWDSNWGSQMFLFQVTVLGTNCVPVNAPCS